MIIFFLRNEQLGFSISLKLMKLFSFSYSAAWLMLIRIIAKGVVREGDRLFIGVCCGRTVGHGLGLKGRILVGYKENAVYNKGKHAHICAL